MFIGKNEIRNITDTSLEGDFSPLTLAAILIDLGVTQIPFIRQISGITGFGQRPPAGRNS